MAKRVSRWSCGDIEYAPQIVRQHGGNGPVDSAVAVRAERDEVGSGVIDLGRGEQ